MTPFKPVRHLLLALALSLAPASADPMGILIPAYVNPGTDPGDVWGRLATAAADIPVIAIMNPDSGPGETKDLNYPDPVHILAQTTAHGRVIGYVHTRVVGGQPLLRDLATVEDETDRYATWYGESGLSGIFVDEMRSDDGQAYPGTSDLTTVREYYHALYLHITTSHPQYLVVGNPGATGGNIQTYLQSSTRAADTLITFEYFSGYENAAPPDWNPAYPAANFANIPYNVPTAAEMEFDLRLARSRNVGFVYITDDYYTHDEIAGDLVNPWDRLPVYWDQEVQLIKSINAGTLPTRLFLTKPPGQPASLFFSGNPGAYQVQTSADLVHWINAGAIVTTPSGAFTWPDPAPSTPQRFYRTAQ